MPPNICDSNFGPPNIYDKSTPMIYDMVYSIVQRVSVKAQTDVFKSVKYVQHVQVLSV